MFIWLGSCSGYLFAAYDSSDITVLLISILIAGTHQCGRYSACVNNAGSYHCVCARGYRASSYNDKQCVDIDECVEFSECSHSCSNTQGTFSYVLKTQQLSFNIPHFFLLP